MPSTTRQSHLTIDPEACHACGRCLVQRACRGMAVIRLERDDPPLIDAARCLHCLICVDRCPYHAVIWT